MQLIDDKSAIEGKTINAFFNSFNIEDEQLQKVF